MNEQEYDWAAIVKSSAFIKLQRKKSLFLLSLWIFVATPYFLLTIGAGYMPELFSIRIFGRMNIGYISCISQFFMTIAIGIYYTWASFRRRSVSWPPFSVHCCSATGKRKKCLPKSTSARTPVWA